MPAAARKHRRNPRADASAQAQWFRVEAPNTPHGHKLAADIAGHRYERYHGFDGKWRLAIDGVPTKPFSSLEHLRAYVSQHAMGGR